MAKRTKKLRPISEARKAIFDAENLSEQNRESLHRQLCESNLKALAELFGVPFVGTPDEVGNAILVKHFESEKKRNKLMLHRANMFSLLANVFFKTFGQPLRRFWQGNMLGFDVCGFDDEVVKSGDRAMSDVVKERWGDVGLGLIKSLLHDPNNPTPESATASGV